MWQRKKSFVVGGLNHLNLFWRQVKGLQLLTGRKSLLEIQNFKLSGMGRLFSKAQESDRNDCQENKPLHPEELLKVQLHKYKWNHCFYLLEQGHTILCGKLNNILLFQGSHQLKVFWLYI